MTWQITGHDLHTGEVVVTAIQAPTVDAAIAIAAQFNVEIDRIYPDIYSWIS